MYSTGVTEPTTRDGPFPDGEELQGLLERARLTLTTNDVGDFAKPGRHQVAHQWNRDAALVVMGLALHMLEPLPLGR